MATSENCQPPSSSETASETYECWPADFRVRTYPSLAEGLASKVRALVSGRNTSDSFANYDQKSSSWKTCQASFLPGLDEYSETWPRSGMTQSGTAFLLQPLARVTGEIASGSWPTPTASDNRQRGTEVATANRLAKGDQIGLEAAVKWPTPRANDAEKRGEIEPTNPRNGLPGAVKLWPTPTANQYEQQNLDTVLERRERIKQSKKNGNGFGLTLAQQVAVEERKMWPTPTTRDWKDGSAEACANVPANGLLGRVVHQFATPQARDYRTGQSERWDNPERSRNLNDQVGGSLNPDWVEWLMGFPIGWTSLPGYRASSKGSRTGSRASPRSATRSSRKSHTK